MATNISRYRKPISCLLAGHCGGEVCEFKAGNVTIPVTASMRKRMGSRSPAAAALRMRTATCVLLVRARSPGLRDFPSFIQNGLQEFQGLGTVRVHSFTPHSLLLPGLYLSTTSRPILIGVMRATISDY